MFPKLVVCNQHPFNVPFSVPFLVPTARPRRLPQCSTMLVTFTACMESMTRHLTCTIKHCARTDSCSAKIMDHSNHVHSAAKRHKRTQQWLENELNNNLLKPSGEMPQDGAINDASGGSGHVDDDDDDDIGLPFS